MVETTIRGLERPVYDVALGRVEGSVEDCDCGGVEWTLEVNGHEWTHGHPGAACSPSVQTRPSSGPLATAKDDDEQDRSRTAGVQTQMVLNYLYGTE